MRSHPDDGPATCQRFRICREIDVLVQAARTACDADVPVARPIAVVMVVHEMIAAAAAVQSAAAAVRVHRRRLCRQQCGMMVSNRGGRQAAVVMVVMASVGEVAVNVVAAAAMDVVGVARNCAICDCLVGMRSVGCGWLIRLIVSQAPIRRLSAVPTAVERRFTVKAWRGDLVRSANGEFCFLHLRKRNRYYWLVCDRNERLESDEPPRHPFNTLTHTKQRTTERRRFRCTTAH